jgi:SPP1 gp7 family putative phage head morphogenesis protein
MADWIDLPFEEAIDFSREQSDLTREQWDELDSRMQLKAFTVARVAEVDVIAEVHAAINDALTKGETLNDFKIRVGEKLRKAWGGRVANPDARMETVFRTNIQTAYNAGRWEQQRTPEARASRPYAMFSSIGDKRTTPICKACNGKIAPLDDQWWGNHYPPLHFNCRSTVIAMTPGQVAARGGATKSLPTQVPSEGFGNIAKDWTPPSESTILTQG